MNTVSPEIFHELDFLAASFLVGILLVLVYDILRICRQLFSHGAFLLAAEDLCYWVASSFVIFAMLYQKNDGLIRGFAVGGVVLGMVLYNQYVSCYTVRYLVIFLKKIIYLVELPFRHVHKRLAPKGLILKAKTKKLIKNLKKRLKKLKKEVKMGISR